LNQLLGSGSLPRARSAGINHMYANMFFQQLRGKAVHCASGGGYHLQHIATIPVCYQRSLNGFNLAANTANPPDQPRFVFD
jgi:hypothetical protein